MSDHDDYDDQPVHHWCGVCGGPCFTWKGSVHGWTCQGCLRVYLDAGAARADAEEAKRRAKLAAKLSTPTPTTATTAGTGGKQRRSDRYDREGGGDGYGPASAGSDRGGRSGAAETRHRDRVTA